MSERALADELRMLYPRVLGKALAFTRTLPDAEDAVQDAIERALSSWPRTGRPDAPEAWLVTVAVNRHRDRVRRSTREERRTDALAELGAMSPWVRGAIPEPEIERGWKDERLALLFACCDPALAPGESAALALTTVLGLDNAEVARAFAVPPRTMEQRLTRARRRLREHGSAEPPAPGSASDRVGAVATAVMLLFNEGYWSASDDAPIRGDLCRLALGLARSLHAAFPDEPETAGLLALCMFHEARRAARLDDHGDPVPLPEQDRSRWDRAMIGAAAQLLERALALGRPGPLQIEAAIVGVHADADRVEATDWREIAILYRLLERWRPTPAVRVNRAFAVSRVDGPSAGLALLDDEFAARDAYVHLVRATLLAELGRTTDADEAFACAEALARNASERAQIGRRRAALASSP